MTSRTLVRRLEQLEAFVLPTDPPEQYVRVHSVSPEGKLVRTLVVKIGQRRAYLADFAQRQLATDNVDYRAIIYRPQRTARFLIRWAHVDD
jgi:hypothetical protein